MNMKSVEMSHYLPEVIRFSGIVAGAAVFSFLLAPFASGRNLGTITARWCE